MIKDGAEKNVKKDLWCTELVIVILNVLAMQVGQEKIVIPHHVQEIVIPLMVSALMGNVHVVLNLLVMNAKLEDV